MSAFDNLELHKDKTILQLYRLNILLLAKERTK